MSSVSYWVCDRCGRKDDHAGRIWHYVIQDINGATVAHLCENCLTLSAPGSEMVKLITERVLQVAP